LIVAARLDVHESEPTAVWRDGDHMGHRVLAGEGRNLSRLIVRVAAKLEKHPIVRAQRPANEEIVSRPFAAGGGRSESMESSCNLRHLAQRRPVDDQIVRADAAGGPACADAQESATIDEESAVRAEPGEFHAPPEAYACPPRRRSAASVGHDAQESWRSLGRRAQRVGVASDPKVLALGKEVLSLAFRLGWAGLLWGFRRSSERQRRGRRRRHPSYGVGCRRQGDGLVSGLERRRGRGSTAAQERHKRGHVRSMPHRLDRTPATSALSPTDARCRRVRAPPTPRFGRRAPANRCWRICAAEARSPTAGCARRRHPRSRRAHRRAR
jgi:hypothetical protein